MNKSPIEKARAALTNGATCAVISGERAETSTLPGIAPMMRWLDTDPELLRGAAVADRVIGRAAALLMAHGGVREAYGALMSEPAAQCLAAQGIACSYDRLVPRIKNRDGTGLCPMESAVMDTNDPAQAHRLLKEKIAQMMK